MNINHILKELDKLFTEKRIGEVEKYLLDNLEKSEIENDRSSTITIINELIGFYRVSSRFKDSIVYCERVIEVMKNEGLQGTISYATTLLNIATIYRAGGKLEESLKYYQETLEIYTNKINENDYRFASLYNNMSLLYQEMKDYEKAYNYLINALNIVNTHDDLEIEVAITHTNLANCLLKLNRPKEALNHVETSLKIFEKYGENKDFHYPSALAAMGEVQFKLKNYDKSIENYIHSLKEIKINIGENMSYAVTCNNLSLVYNEIGNKEEADKFRNEAKRVYENIKK